MSAQASGTAAARAAAVLGLLVLAPWVGEYLLGNVPLGMLVALPFLVPLYGGGALVIREVARRTGRGWPAIVLLGAAYGVIEAGLFDQSLFNPSFEGHRFLEVTPVPVLGISASNAMAFVVGHAVWSIAIPIAIVELLAPGIATTPWLGRKGLAGAFVLYLGGGWIIFRDLQESEGFMASPGQLTGAALTALALIAVAFAVGRRRPTAPGGRPAPRPAIAGAAAFVLANVFFIRPESWLGVALGAALLAVAAVLFTHWSRLEGWGTRHRFAVVAGTLPTYAWAGFVLTNMVRRDDTVAWVGNAVFAVIAVGLLAVTAWRVHGRTVGLSRSRP